MMGSTSNALDKERDNFKNFTMIHALTQLSETETDKLLRAYTLCLSPMEWGYEGFIDKYGYPVFDSPDEPVEAIDGEFIHYGVIDHWENEVDGLKHDSDGLNEYYRQFPRTEKTCF